MSSIAIVEKFLTSKPKKNSLTIIEKYRFPKHKDAADFIQDLLKVDRKIIYTEIEDIDD